MTHQPTYHIVEHLAQPPVGGGVGGGAAAAIVGGAGGGAPLHGGNHNLAGGNGNGTGAGAGAGGGGAGGANAGGAGSSSASAHAGGTSKKSKDKGKSVSSNPQETRTIVFEWPLSGLKKIFEESTSDVKSKVIRSVPFGDGQWSVLFYAQSGSEQNCSLYLNAEPLSSERVHPMTTAAKKRIAEEQGLAEEVAGKSARKDGVEWHREGTYRFTFSIYTPNKHSLIAQKEAPGYSFSHTAQNWGWSGFCSRDRVYFNNHAAKEADAVLITVSLTCHAVPAKSTRPKGTTVPKNLVWAMGELLDDPELSDVCFHFPRKTVSSSGIIRYQAANDIHAIRKILMQRCEYFRNLLGGDFAEAEAASSEDGHESVARDRPEETLDQDAMALDEDHQQSTRIRQASPEGNGAEVVFVSKRRRPVQLRRDGGHDASDAEEDELDFDDGIFADSDVEYSEDSAEEEDDAIDEDEDESVSEDERAGATGGVVEEESPSQASDSGHAGGRESRASGSASGHAEGNTSRRAADSGAHEAGEEEEEEEAVEDDEIAALSRSGMKNEGGGKHHRSSSSSKTHRESDRVSEDLTGKFSDLATVSKPKKRPAETLEENPPTTKSRKSSSRRKRRKVTISDAAYTTFFALLHYLYTDSVDFAPLTSSFLPLGEAQSEASMPGLGTSRSQAAALFNKQMLTAYRARLELISDFCRQHPDKQAPCSAKAMYKLADKMNIQELKQRAKEHIQKSLTEQNIVWELFSGFTAKYPEIMKMQTEFALQHWTKVKKMDAMKNIFARGSAHPGLAEVWPHLLSQLEYKKSESEEGDSIESDGDS